MWQLLDCNHFTVIMFWDIVTEKRVKAREGERQRDGWSEDMEKWWTDTNWGRWRQRESLRFTERQTLREQAEEGKVKCELKASIWFQMDEQHLKLCPPHHRRNGGIVFNHFWTLVQKFKKYHVFNIKSSTIRKWDFSNNTEGRQIECLQKKIHSFCRGHGLKVECHRLNLMKKTLMDTLWAVCLIYDSNIIGNWLEQDFIQIGAL